MTAQNYEIHNYDMKSRAYKISQIYEINSHNYDKKLESHNHDM